MNNVLRVYSYNNEFIGELFYNEKSYAFSNDTNIYFKEAISYLINNSKEIILLNENYVVRRISLEKVGFFNFIDKYLFENLKYNWGFKCQQLIQKYK